MDWPQSGQGKVNSAINFRGRQVRRVWGEGRTGRLPPRVNHDKSLCLFHRDTFTRTMEIRPVNASKLWPENGGAGASTHCPGAASRCERFDWLVYLRMLKRCSGASCAPAKRRLVSTKGLAGIIMSFVNIRRPMHHPIEPTLRTGAADRPALRPVTPGLQRVHVLILLGLALGFSVLTLLRELLLSSGDWNEPRNHLFAGVLLTISGPFIGPILRPYDPYSVKIAWMLFPYCAAILGLGTIGQWLPLPFKRGAQGLRLTLWTLGLLGWFAGGVFSFLCALGE